MVGIYQIRNKVNGMRYIGQSIDIKRRWVEERNCKQVNPHLQRAFNKYGMENFAFEVLCECAVDELSELEILLISETGSYIKTKGYNKTLGGEGGKWTEEQKRKRSERIRGAGNTFYGCKHTEEMKRKMSEMKRGKNHPAYGMRRSAETKRKQSETKIGAKNPMAKKVNQYALTGELIAVYPSTADASRKYGMTKNAIINCLAGRTQTSCGFRWEYVD